MNDLIGRLLDQFAATGAVEWIGSVAGVAGVWLTVRERVSAWPFFVVCYGCYAYLAIEASLYAALVMQLVFILLSFYGWYKWTSGSRKDGGATLAVSHLPTRLYPAVALCWIGGTLLAGAALARYTEAYRPFIDAFATMGGFIAQWMLGRKYIGTWPCWIVSDLVFIGLWGPRGYVVTVLLYTVFIILAVAGFRQWSRVLRDSRV